jgi:hypothetical protein
VASIRSVNLQNKRLRCHAIGGLIVLLCLTVGFGVALAQPVARSEGFIDRAFGIAVSGPLFLTLAAPLVSFLSSTIGLLLLCNLVVSRVVRNGSRFVIASYILVGLYWAFLMNLTAYVDYVSLAH